jgi:hypothetical protein
MHTQTETSKSVKIISVVYEGVSKIFQTGATIYTAVVVAQSAGRW